MAKKFRKITLILLFFAFLSTNKALSFNGHREGANYGRGHEDTLWSLPLGELSEEEREAILYMREEEKLARDVYLTLYQHYGLIILANIAESEQNHMNSVKMLIDRYGLDDPVTNEEDIGNFTNPQLAALYNELVEKGLLSEIEALKVGALIEELDIHDLEERLAIIDQEDVQMVFERLKAGSYNHLQAFVSALSAYGEEYNPQYLPQEEFEDLKK